MTLGWSSQAGEACCMHGRDEKRIQELRRKTWREEHSDELSVDEKIILEWILGKKSGES